jgi:hypothetical protein
MYNHLEWFSWSHQVFYEMALIIGDISINIYIYIYIYQSNWIIPAFVRIKEKKIGV